MNYPPPPPDPGDPYGRPAPSDPYAQPDMPSGGYPGYPSDPAAGPLVPYGKEQTGGWHSPYAPVPENDAVLTTIGDIAITQTTVITPAGRLPIKGSVWTSTDMSHTTEGIATVGIVLAVVTVILFVGLCGLGLLGLLFLLMKEQKTQGSVQVTVQGNGVYHSTMIPVHSPQAVSQIMQSVNYARSLAATN
ncbi:hypothetical protein [Streptomonospora litoralis]|uniref:Uncharacterized protein n=1 Tax=Streptomonospora litoralis TaxID=2498135 RepID=A0A4P6Q8T8_9ACTN|nr:hypothetical protein [Streptomonospora litoralis]QBI55417.1 hypothetical protein EKD16_18265 [Streptomonospora litoralis]